MVAVALEILSLFAGSPWAAIGGGYALYRQSAKFSNGQNDANDALLSRQPPDQLPLWTTADHAGLQPGLGRLAH